MIVPRVIERKRDGGRIEPEEWRVLARDYADGSIPDYQMAALLMAVFLRGMDTGETSALTEAMLESGHTLDLSHLSVPRIDKHSTGGVGDKVSIILAPLIASLGVAVPMMSGRGLAHTGGTLDKLESIPGFRTDLSLDQAARQIERIGCALFGQTTEIAPADRKIYALRNATATVESVPLIASSIMSKKLAEGLTGLVLDVKRGSGAFLPQLGIEVAQAMIALGEAHGCPVVALLTAMDRPLGHACGNAVEVEECIAALHGKGPPDLMEVTFALGAEMLMLAGVAFTPPDARAMMTEAIETGRAASTFQAIIAAQGGDPEVVGDPALLPQAPLSAEYESPVAGAVAMVDPRAIGWGLVELGAGRTRMDDSIDPAVGLIVSVKPGDVVARGQPLGRVRARTDAAIARGLAVLRRAVVVGAEPIAPLALISHRVTRAGVEELDS
jgi:pyrimidine-nucleoside phosphorylase